MKFSTKEDIEAPIDAVFDHLCDFENFERAAMRRGAEVQRVDSLRAPGVGLMWDAAFDMRGKRRQVRIEMITFDRPNEMVIDSISQGLNGTMGVELVALSRTRTRALVSLELRPRTLPARLMVQSMKLAKTSLTKKFKLRVAEFAKNVEDKQSRPV